MFSWSLKKQPFYFLTLKLCCKKANKQKRAIKNNPPPIFSTKSWDKNWNQKNNICFLVWEYKNTFLTLFLLQISFAFLLRAFLKDIITQFFLVEKVYFEALYLVGASFPPLLLTWPIKTFLSHLFHKYTFCFVFYSFMFNCECKLNGCDHRICSCLCKFDYINIFLSLFWVCSKYFNANDKSNIESIFLCGKYK